MLNLSYLSVHNGVGESGRIALQKSIDSKADEDDDDMQQIFTEWEEKMKIFYYHERVALLVAFYVVTIIAVVGNTLTLYVVTTRKQRLLFKICLLSLSLSDLIYSVSCGVNYISKLHHDQITLWHLNEFLCSFMPFMQTTSLLSGSFSLTFIAIDRYMAIFTKRKTHWQPGLAFCVVGFTIVWAISAALSCPMLFSFNVVKVYIVPESQSGYYIGYYCFMLSKAKTLYYYCIIFVFVFLPLLIAFIVFNGSIAYEIWKRRKAPGSKQNKALQSSEDSSSAEAKNSSDTKSSDLQKSNSTGFKGTSSTAFKSTNLAIVPKQQEPQIFVVQQPPPLSHQMHNNTRNNERHRRQMRMFKVILILMSVFIMLRLPSWIFLLYRLYNHTPLTRVIWLITFLFCIFGIINSMANPFLYTFLSETIRFTSYVGITCCKLCQPKLARKNYANNAAMFAQNDVLNKQKNDNGGVYLGN